MKEKNIRTNLDVLHVYYGSQGSGGLYLDEIYSSLKRENIRQEVIVSYYYPFNYGKKIFFKYTDLASGMKKSKLRIFLRALEFAYGLFYSLIYILSNRPTIINYSLNRGFILDVFFILILKFLSSSKIVITCHDVIPFSNNPKDYINQMKYRKFIFTQVDFLIVHNKKSLDDLNQVFDICKEKIYFHLFPIMDLNRMNSKPSSCEKKYDFAFIGHLRKEKGVDLLIDAWRIFHKDNPYATLLIAGNAAYNSNMFDTIKNLNVTFILNYLSDEEYCRLLNESKTIVLPYLTGTNSGVLYNIVASDCNVIYSDLPMFKENILLSKTGSFVSGDKIDLVQKLSYFYINNDLKHANYLIEYKKNFHHTVIESYKKLLSYNKSHENSK